MANSSIRSWKSKALAATLLLSTSCTTWQPAAVPPEQIPTRHPQAVVRVFRSGGLPVVLTGPYLRADTLHGAGGCAFGICSIPLTDIRSVQIQRVDQGRTALLAVGLGVTAVLAVVAAIEASQPPPPPPAPLTFSSCPTVYSWDGHRWRLDSGTFGGAILRALARTDVDNLNFATAVDGVVRLRLADELQETEYIDAVSLAVVDHEPGLTVAPDGAAKLHALRSLSGPVAARDFAGRDALARVAASDGWSWESALVRRDTARLTQIRDGLVVSFMKPPQAQRAHLVVDGHVTPWGGYLMYEFIRAHGSATAAWYAAMDSAPQRARQLGRVFAGEAFLGVAVRAGTSWQPKGMFWEAAPELVKRQVLELDLSDVAGDSVVVRLESAPSFWLIDHVAVSYEDDQPFEMREVSAARARGATNQPVLSLLARVDSAEFVMEPGDWAELEFDVAPVPAGLERTYLLRSTGWYRIHSPGVGEPQHAVLARIASEPLAVSRIATARLNEALAALAERR